MGYTSSHICHQYDLQYIDNNYQQQDNLSSSKQPIVYILKKDKQIQYKMLQLLEKHYVVLMNRYENIQYQRRIYYYRKNNNPCLVGICRYVLDVSGFKCLANYIMAIVFTEHISFRLKDFKLQKEIKKYISSDMNRSVLPSLTCDYAIYIMISSLHGYQQLAQFGKLCYPTAGTIGVNWDGQIKVWINENWAINYLASPAHSEELVVEELINLVEERTEGHFDFAYKDECNRNMYNKTFDIMQAILADYLMQFHQGKRSLIGKLAVMKGQYYNNSKGQSYDSYQNAQTRVSLWSSENKDYQRQINKQNKTKVYQSDSSHPSISPIQIRTINQYYHPYPKILPYNSSRKTSFASDSFVKKPFKQLTKIEIPLMTNKYQFQNIVYLRNRENMPRAMSQAVASRVVPVNQITSLLNSRLLSTGTTQKSAQSSPRRQITFTYQQQSTEPNNFFKTPYKAPLSYRCKRQSEKSTKEQTKVNKNSPTAYLDAFWGYFIKRKLYNNHNYCKRKEAKKAIKSAREYYISQRYKKDKYVRELTDEFKFLLDLGQKAKKSHEKEEEKIEVELVKEEKEDNSPFLKTVEEDRLERFGTIHETEDDMKSNEAEA